MKIQHYSRLITAESEEQYRARVLGIFQTRVDKRRAKGETVIFDPDVVNVDIDRWFYQKARGNRDIKPQLEAYKTHEDLHEAMRNFKSKQELEYDKKTGETEVEGKQLVLSLGQYKVFKATTVKALMLLAEGSNWCVQYSRAAEDYMVTQKSTFYVVLRGTDRYVAIRETEENKPNVEVWWYTDYELRKGTHHAEYEADLVQEDFDTINEILKGLGFNPLSEDSEFFDLYPDIQTYLEISREKEDIRRFMYNQRFYPELAKSLLMPGMTIESGVDLTELPVESIPEGIKFLGGLFLSKTKITELPEDLYVGGDLSLSQTNISSLPSKLYVGGELTLDKTPFLKELPKGLRIPGTLSLEDSSVEYLPEGLDVGGDMRLYNSQVWNLPKRLCVGGDLILLGSNITNLPEGFLAGSDVDLRGTAIRSIGPHSRFSTRLILFECDVTVLPEDIRINEELILSQTKVKTLSRGLHVGGDVVLSETEIKTLPEDFYVGGSLNLQDTGITELPKSLYVGKNIYGTNPKTGREYQDEYREQRGKK